MRSAQPAVTATATAAAAAAAAAAAGPGMSLASRAPRQAGPIVPITVHVSSARFPLCCFVAHEAMGQGEHPAHRSARRAP
eukprot:scaffold7227_cov399-Prasinococcus_capsulatus_cf.AAC.7